MYLNEFGITFSSHKRYDCHRFTTWIWHFKVAQLKETQHICNVLASQKCYNVYSPFFGAFYHQFLKRGSELELRCLLSDPLKPLPHRRHGQTRQIILSYTRWTDIKTKEASVVQQRGEADGETPPASAPLRRCMTRSPPASTPQTGCKINISYASGQSPRQVTRRAPEKERITSTIKALLT